MMRSCASLAALFMSGGVLLQATPAAGVQPSAPGTRETRAQRDARMKWWRDARFGMFIHWGIYSVAGGEWKGRDYGKEMGGASAEWLMNSANISREEYRNTLAPQFNPTEFDAKEWVSLAKDAGMKYIVITAKHHDGFCMFDTKYTDYNIVKATPFRRDVIRELSDECRRQGMHFGIYYSQYKDWYHRGRGRGRPGTMTNDEYVRFVENQLRELLTNYGDIAVLWFDVGGNDVEEANRYGALVRRLQPQTVICSRLYSRRVPAAQRKYADFASLPDRTVAPKRMEGDWETCMTIRRNWGYDRDDDNWKSTKDIIERLVLSAARGVNFLLNVGPTPRGTLCPQEIERLKDIGAWMKVNGESIHGTRYSPVDYEFPWGAMTQKGRTVYLHIMKWDPDGIVFNGIAGKPARAYLLADPGRKTLMVRYDATGRTTKVEVPRKVPDAADTVIVVEYDSPLRIDPNAKGKYYWSTSTAARTRRRNPGGKGESAVR